MHIQNGIFGYEMTMVASAKVELHDTFTQNDIAEDDLAAIAFERGSAADPNEQGKLDRAKAHFQGLSSGRRFDFPHATQCQDYNTVNSDSPVIVCVAVSYRFAVVLTSLVPYLIQRA